MNNIGVVVGYGVHSVFFVNRHSSSAGAAQIQTQCHRLIHPNKCCTQHWSCPCVHTNRKHDTFLQLINYNKSSPAVTCGITTYVVVLFLYKNKINIYMARNCCIIFKCHNKQTNKNKHISPCFINVSMVSKSHINEWIILYLIDMSSFIYIHTYIYKLEYLMHFIHNIFEKISMSHKI